MQWNYQLRKQDGQVKVKWPASLFLKFWFLNKASNLLSQQDFRETDPSPAGYSLTEYRFVINVRSFRHCEIITRDHHPTDNEHIQMDTKPVSSNFETENLKYYYLYNRSSFFSIPCRFWTRTTSWTVGHGVYSGRLHHSVTTVVFGSLLEQLVL